MSKTPGTGSLGALHNAITKGVHRTPGTDPLGALHAAMTFSSLDWGAAQDTAWIYGIAVGWDGPAMAELADRFGWPPEKVTLLRKLRRNFRAAERAEERRRARHYPPLRIRSANAMILTCL